MATNKHALIRYQALDKCFRNSGRKYFIEDLVNACNEAIYNHTGIMSGVKKRQVQDDITYMESESSGWSINLIRHRDGRRVFYQYEDTNYSISNQPLNSSEANMLRDTIQLLTRFKGMPHFEWMEELVARLESSFLLDKTSPNIVGFEQNPFLKGLEYFSDIFFAIANKQALSVTYKRFGKEPKQMVFHPYYLKQYNNRWFLFGLLPEYADKMIVTNLALDRIERVEKSSKNYIENNSIDFDEYFEDVVGVTVYQDRGIETIELAVDATLVPYLETKPIHGSQKIQINDNGSAKIELRLQINYEFETILISYADRVSILSPIWLREKIKQRASQIIDNNK